MKTASFVNFTDSEFTGAYNGKKRTIAPGKKINMPDYMARHYATHLVNRELLRIDKKGNLVYKNGEKMTSPKNPEQVPIFMELFNKAYFSNDDEIIGNEDDDADMQIELSNTKKEKKANINSPNLDDKTPFKERLKN